MMFLLDGHVGRKKKNSREWILLDLGKSAPVTSVTINWEAAFATEYQIQISREDGKTWETLESVTDGEGLVEFWNFEETIARFVRIYFIKRGTPWAYSVWEIIVRGL